VVAAVGRPCQLSVLRSTTTDVRPRVQACSPPDQSSTGIGKALYEEAVYNEDGQSLTATFMDYLLRPPRRSRTCASSITSIRPRSTDWR
jgi:hypothetical protein